MREKADVLQRRTTFAIPENREAELLRQQIGGTAGNLPSGRRKPWCHVLPQEPTRVQRDRIAPRNVILTAGRTPLRSVRHRAFGFGLFRACRIERCVTASEPHGVDVPEPDPLSKYNGGEN